MFTIFKWFFGITALIVAAYLIIVLVRSVLSVTSNTVNTVASTASADDIATTSGTLINWFMGLYKPIHTPVAVQPAVNENIGSDGQYRNPIADEILKQYSDWNLDLGDSDNFDRRWGNTNYTEQLFGSQNTNTQKVAGSNENSPNQKPILVTVPEYSEVRQYQVITGYAPPEAYTNRFFPVFILNDNKEVIGTVKAFVNGDPNRNGLIPFRAVLEYDNPNRFGYLLFNKQGLLMRVRFAGPVSDYISQIPSMLFFSSDLQTSFSQKCVVAGCQMQFCVDQNLVDRVESSCKYLPGYACYQKAVCERSKTTGKCGWRQDSSLTKCLEYYN